MIVLRRAIGVARVLLHIGTGFVLAVGTGAFFSPQRPQARRATRWWLARLVRVLNVDVEVRGTPLAQPALVVSNHVSWLDIPVLGGLTGVHFLSKSEVADWPLIGKLADAGGTLYIQRGRGQVRERARQIGQFIRDGHSVLVFPEGTTTAGDSVREFHSPLFAAASDDGHAVQPVAIRYLDAQGRPDRHVPFIGDDEFTTHLWRLLGAPRVRAQVVFLPPLTGDNPRELATQAHAAVRDVIR
jgi:1-acyl-sn-glycerol-3-phosphate acyltransferase